MSVKIIPSTDHTEHAILGVPRPAVEACIMATRARRLWKERKAGLGLRKALRIFRNRHKMARQARIPVNSCLVQIAKC